MKIKIDRVEEKTASNGDEYRLVKDTMGNRYSVWDQNLFGHLVAGDEIDVITKTKGSFTNITGVNIVTEKIVESKPTADKPDWNGKERRMVRMHTQKVAGEVAKIMYSDIQMTKSDIMDSIIETAHQLEEDIYRE